MAVSPYHRRDHPAGFPFLVDSIRMALKRLNITAHMMLHQPLHLIRGEGGKIGAILDLDNTAEQTSVETAFLIEIDHLTGEEEMDALTAELNSVAREVALAVGDWQPMLTRLNEIIEELPKRKNPVSQAEVDSCVAFLQMGGRPQLHPDGLSSLRRQGGGGDHEILPQPESSLGLMKNSIKDEGQRLGTMPASARHAALSSDLLILTKSNSKSGCIVRPMWITSASSASTSTARWWERIASSACMPPPSTTPVRPRSPHQPPPERIMAASGFESGSHAHKALLNVLETYPRDELIQAREEELLATGLGCWRCRSGTCCACSCAATSTAASSPHGLCHQGALLTRRCGSRPSRFCRNILAAASMWEFNVYFTEGVLARTHYIVRVNNNNVDVDVNEVQNNLIEAARSWDDRLDSVLLSHHGEACGNELRRRFSTAFPVPTRKMCCRALPSRTSWPWMD